jgi:hypothetical protein
MLRALDLRRFGIPKIINPESVEIVDLKGVKKDKNGDMQYIVRLVLGNTEIEIDFKDEASYRHEMTGITNVQVKF